MRVGVHCSVRKGFVGALREAADLGCETLQIFTENPRGWRTRIYLEEEFETFQRERKRLGLHPVVVHSPYLPNLCTSQPELYLRSCRALKEDLLRCEKLGADYLVIHPGAYSPEADLETGMRQLTTALNEAMAQITGKAQVLIENMAGGGRRIGSRFSEIAEILKRTKEQKRIGVCFDTCHAFGAGYDLRRSETVDAVFSEFEKTIGLDRIKMFHVNDSKTPLGSQRDLHQHLGQGSIGLEGFRLVFQRRVFQNCALILETPKQPPESDRENLRRLRSCLPKATVVESK